MILKRVCSQQALQNTPTPARSHTGVHSNVVLPGKYTAFLKVGWRCMSNDSVHKHFNDWDLKNFKKRTPGRLNAGVPGGV